MTKTNKKRKTQFIWFSHVIHLFETFRDKKKVLYFARNGAKEPFDWLIYVFIIVQIKREGRNKARFLSISYKNGMASSPAVNQAARSVFLPV